MTTMISIVLPTYNQAHYLPEALDGVFAQTYPNYELIVVNDGSTDDTAGVLAEYRLQHDFTIIEQENRGLPGALNAGFIRSHGKYLTWTSSDNVMHPDMLNELAQTLDRNPAIGLVYADFFLMDDDGRDLGLFETTEYDRHWLLYTNLVHCCFLYRRECMERVKGYDQDFVYSEDWEYWIRLSRYCQMKRVPQALYHYRLHRASMTSEMQDGTARHIGHAQFAAYIRRRMPLRWSLLMLKRTWARLGGDNHPIIRERQAWLSALNKTHIEKHDMASNQRGFRE